MDERSPLPAPDGSLRPLEPVVTAPLFPGLHQRLVALLRGLGGGVWGRPTVAASWTVRDVAAHLLDVQVRRLSVLRDGHAPAPDRDAATWDGLVGWLDDLNADWVRTMRRASPGVLVDLLDTVGPVLAEAVAGVDPDAPAPFPVAWAAEAASPMWFDVGRDYTELWHHQAQICLAVFAPPLDDRQWLHPVLSLSVRALRRALAETTRPDRTAVVLRIDGHAGGVWSAVRGEGGWAVFEGEAASPSAEVALPAAAAWKLFFNALGPEEARASARVSGDEGLCDAVLGARSVMVTGPRTEPTEA